jgi:DNA (cytosine-5)-methyltransferase 1
VCGDRPGIVPKIADADETRVPQPRADQPSFQMTPKHLDLHSGIGGFALAARWSGYETIGLSEIEPFCNELLSQRFPSVPNLGDIRKLCRRPADCYTDIENPENFDIHLIEGGEVYCPICSDEAGEPIAFNSCACIKSDDFTTRFGWPDVVTSGFPCQDISFAGKGAGLAGTRSGLWTETARIVSELAPPFLVFENVAALKTRGFDTIADTMERIGYAIGTAVVPGYAVGAAHQRERVFAVAHLEGKRMEGLRTEGFQKPHTLAYSPLPIRTSDGQWEIEPDLRRTNDGVPGRLDRSARTNQRLHALGNAIIPQIAAAIFDILPHLAKRGELRFNNN